MQIEKLLKNHPKTKKFFKGVYSSNTLPKLLKSEKKMFVVVNLDPSYKNGSHWIAMMKTPKNKHNVYFDSYGKKPPFKHFKTFLKNKYNWNKQQLQHDLSTACGQWCIFFIWEKCNGKEMKDIISKFSKKDLLSNDHIVNRFVEENFKADLKTVEKKFLRSQIAKSFEENQKWKKISSKL